MKKCFGALVALLLSFTALAVGQTPENQVPQTRNQTSQADNQVPQAGNQEVAYAIATNIYLANCQEAIAQRASNMANTTKVGLDPIRQQCDQTGKLVDTIGTASAPQWSSQANNYRKVLASFAFQPNGNHISTGTYRRALSVNRAVQDAINSTAISRTGAKSGESADTIRALWDNANRCITKVKAEQSKPDSGTMPDDTQLLNQLVSAAEQLMMQLNAGPQQQQ